MVFVSRLSGAVVSESGGLCELAFSGGCLGCYSGAMRVLAPSTLWQLAMTSRFIPAGPMCLQVGNRLQ